MAKTGIESQFNRYAGRMIELLLADGTLKKPGRVNIFFLENEKLRKMKKEFLGKDVPVVDVLSFPESEHFPQPENELKLFGEIFINKAIAKEDRDRGLYLLLHGILHLAGYRHDLKRDTISMQKQEKEICRMLKIPFPYAQ